MSISYSYTRAEPRIIANHESGKQNVITDVVAGEEGEWHASIEAKKAAPVFAQFERQKPQPEAPAEESE